MGEGGSTGQADQAGVGAAVGVGGLKAGTIILIGKQTAKYDEAMRKGMDLAATTNRGRALEVSRVALRFPPEQKAPRYPLPKPESGRYHLVRFVRSEGWLDVFGEMFPAPPEAIYEYVRLTIDVESQRLGVFLDDKQIDEFNYQLRK